MKRSVRRHSKPTEQKFVLNLLLSYESMSRFFWHLRCVYKKSYLSLFGNHRSSKNQSQALVMSLRGTFLLRIWAHFGELWVTFYYFNLDFEHGHFPSFKTPLQIVILSSVYVHEIGGLPTHKITLKLPGKWMSLVKGSQCPKITLKVLF